MVLGVVMTKEVVKEMGDSGGGGGGVGSGGCNFFFFKVRSTAL